MKTNNEVTSARSGKTLEEQIKVMQAAANGKLIVEIYCNKGVYKYTVHKPEDVHWAWNEFDYDVYEEPKTKPSINWEHVEQRFKWMATDVDGNTYLFSIKPEKRRVLWESEFSYILASVFSSFVPGTCNWKDSLVERPEGI